MAIFGLEDAARFAAACCSTVGVVVVPVSGMFAKFWAAMAFAAFSAAVLRSSSVEEPLSGSKISGPVSALSTAQPADPLATSKHSPNAKPTQRSKEGRDDLAMGNGFKRHRYS